MKAIERSWGKELYYKSFRSVAAGIQNDRIKEEVMTRHDRCIPIRGESVYVVRLSHKGFIMNITRMTDGLPPYTLYEAPRMPKSKDMKKIVVEG